MFYKYIIKPLLFLIAPEQVHHQTMKLLTMFIQIPGGLALLKFLFSPKKKNVLSTVAGINFPNPVGLAAGFDKDARYLKIMHALGFGFIEVGTVTPLPQPGNERPRLFRLPKDEALINRMGFNNEGVDVMAARLHHWQEWKIQHNVNTVVGANIGKNKNTPNENAVVDFAICFEKLFDVADYFVVNVSSPNTPGLRELQEREQLRQLLIRLQEINHNHESPKPLFLKIAPDVTNELLDDIISITLEANFSGIVATNTTVSREGLNTSKSEIDICGAGGLSGLPLANRSTEIIKYIKSKAGNKLAVIGVGGIHSFADAKEKLAAGADLLQVYTGFIYTGPGLIKSILKTL